MTKATLQRSARIYSLIVQLYPKRYRQEFGEEMKYVFLESLKEAEKEDSIGNLWLRTILDAGKTIIMQHKENNHENKLTKRLARWAIGVVLLLLIPLTLTWNWSLNDYAFAFIVLFGASLSYELLARKMSNKLYKFAAGLAVINTLVLIWVNAAVGIIGDGPVNMLYISVPLVGLIGAFITHFKPFGLARALFAMAITQMIIPIIALMIWNPSFTPGIVPVFGLNAFFASLFIIAALLFRRVYNSSSRQKLHSK